VVHRIVIVHAVRTRAVAARVLTRMVTTTIKGCGSPRRQHSLCAVRTLGAAVKSCPLYRCYVMLLLLCVCVVRLVLFVVLCYVLFVLCYLMCV
jgi:hypothetical protein